MKRVGTKFPTAFAQISAVVLTPRSADAIVPTCFLLVAPTILGGLLGTVVIPVSSQL